MRMQYARKVLTSCTTTTLVGADQEVRKRLEKAAIVGTVSAVIAFATAEPEGKAAAEFLPILYQKLWKPVGSSAWDFAELHFYQRMGYSPQAQFEVCRPKWLLKDAIVIRPVKTPQRLPGRVGYMPLQPLPAITFDTLNHPNSNPAAAPAVTIPLCDWGLIAPEKTLGDMINFGEISGHVVLTYSQLVVPEPGVNVKVDLIGPAPASCTASFGGYFRFRNLPPGKYVLQVSKLLYGMESTTVSVKAQDTTQLAIHLKPLL
jgi:hypothetical protein